MFTLKEKRGDTLRKTPLGKHNSVYPQLAKWLGH